MNKKIENPEKVMNTIKSELVKEINEIKKKFGVDYREIEEYLRVNEPSISAEIDSLYVLIDTNIFEQYMNKKLTSRQYKAWKRNVQNWKEKMKERLEKYTEFEECLLLVA